MDIALFSPSSLFGGDDDSSVDGETTEAHQSYIERKHQFPEMELVIREFSFHQLNANLLWPGTFAFAEWLMQNQSLIEGRHCIELGSGTGALAIFLRKSCNLEITTSDYDDNEIEENIAHNCRANGITPVLAHIKLKGNFKVIGPLEQDSWGNPFPIAEPDWDLVLASDILLYVKQYTDLIKSLCFLMNSYKPKKNKLDPCTRSKHTSGLPVPCFLMSWRRRIGKKEEALFFTGCEKAGLEVRHMGSRVYCINRQSDGANS